MLLYRALTVVIIKTQCTLEYRVKITTRRQSS